MKKPDTPPTGTQPARAAHPRIVTITPAASSSQAFRSTSPRIVTVKPEVTTPVTRLLILLEEKIANDRDRIALLNPSYRFTEAEIDAVAEKLFAALPKQDRKTPLDERVGPFYRAADYGIWQGITKQAVSSRIRNRTILAIKSPSGKVNLPAFQFDTTGKPLPGLSAVLKAFDPDGDDQIGCALWLNRPASRFNGRTPAEMLRTGNHAAVLDTAVRIGQALAV